MQTEDGHLDMMDGLIVELLKDKWKTFVGHRFVIILQGIFSLR